VTRLERNQAAVGERDLACTAAERAAGELFLAELAEPRAAVIDGVDRGQGRDDVRQGVELALGERRLGDRILLWVGAPVHHARRHHKGNEPLLDQALGKVPTSVASRHGAEA